MAEEKIMTFSLRKRAVETPKWRRSRDTMSILRRDLERLSKGKKVKIDSKVSEHVWSRGQKAPKMSLKLRIKKADDGSIEAKLA